MDDLILQELGIQIFSNKIRVILPHSQVFTEPLGLSILL
jgi:hypothetical protein